MKPVKDVACTTPECKTEHRWMDGVCLVVCVCVCEREREREMCDLCSVYASAFVNKYV